MKWRRPACIQAIYDGGFQLLVDILRREVMARRPLCIRAGKGRANVAAAIQVSRPLMHDAEMRRRGPRSAVVSFTRCSIPKAVRRELCTMCVSVPMQLHYTACGTYGFLAYQAVTSPAPIRPAGGTRCLIQQYRLKVRAGLHQPARMGAEKPTTPKWSRCWMCCVLPLSQTCTA